MDPQYVHRFIVRLRLEPAEIEGESREWRGHVDHVEGGERLYFRDLDEIIRFIREFLQKTERPVPGLGDNAPDESGEDIDLFPTLPSPV